MHKFIGLTPNSIIYHIINRKGFPYITLQYAGVSIENY